VPPQALEKASKESVEATSQAKPEASEDTATGGSGCPTPEE
jgi:hypothetical protein